MKKTFTFFITMLAIFWFTNAGAQTEWLWAHSAGNNSYDYAHAVATDIAGNSYMTGEYNTNIDFGNGFTYTSNGSSDLFIVKYNQAGNSVWAMSAGGDDADISQSIAIDESGNFYIAGYYKSSEMVLGTFTLTNAGGNTFDIFVAKINPSGTVLWAKSVGGTGDDRGYGVAVDSIGNVFVTGYFVSGTISFDAQTLINSGALDLFLVKYNPDGTAVWARSATGSSSGTERSFSVALDKGGNPAVCGGFNSASLTFGDIILNKHANFDIFVAKYTAAGMPLWADNRGTNSDNEAYSVAFDNLSNCYVTGSFKSSTLVFGDISYTNQGHMDAFLFKYGPAGETLWAATAGGPLEDAGRSVCVDNHGYLHYTGYYKSESIWLGTNILTNVSPSTADLFVCEYNPAGLVILSKGAGGTGDDIPYSVAVDTARNFFLSGYFSSPTLVFGTTTLTLGGTTDPFIVKSSNVVITGISSNAGNNSVAVYPNPATDKISFTVSQNSQCMIYDISGKLCQSFIAEKGTVNRNVLSLNKGIYLLKVVSGEKVFTTKFVKE